MKLEVGMYVRTDEGIAKVIKKRKNPYGEETIFIIDKPFMYHLTDFLRTAEDMIDINFEEDTEQIKGASHNIIELLQVGDVITTNNLCGEITKIDIEDNKIWIACCDYETCRSEDILSIVTKEQFESMSYKVGE